MAPATQLVLRPFVAERRSTRRSRSPETAKPTAGPIVKWVGGKSKLLGELTARSPRHYVRYFEPFFGGGALFFRLAPGTAVLSDANGELMDCYRTIRDDVDGAIRALGRHCEQHSEEHYYAVRESWNAPAPTTPIERAAAFVYLNKTCYNGLWRVNSKGAFNVPMGRYDKPRILDEEGLRAAASALANATLEHAPFDHVLGRAQAGDFVYFDPPYDPVSETAYFTGYTADAFTRRDQERLALVFRTLADRGCAVLLSNSDTPFIRQLYAGFHIDTVKCARAINSRADARGAVSEVIIGNRF